jgi:hypothetical protein
MTTIIYIFLLVSSVFLSGCRQRSQPSEEKAPEKKACLMLEIENLAVTEKALTLDYRVSNHFGYGIWVCEDIDVDYEYHVETRIDAETVWIKLRFNLESNVMPYEAVLAKYRLLLPGESYSGRILLDLPIRNASPVYDFNEDRKKHEQIVLQRAVFEVGYFRGDSIYGSILIQDNQIEPRIEEEIEDGQSRKFLYFTELWPGISEEKSAKVDITDVNIPCSVVVDDK